MPLVIEHLKAHYEVRKVEFGVLYRWRPECVTIECDCGQKQSLTASRKGCAECGVDHESIVKEMVDVRPEDKVEHPWRFLQPHMPTRGT